MPQPLAQSADLAALWRPLTEAEAITAVAKIVVASALLRHHVPTLDARLDAGTLSPDLVKGVVVEAVKRSMQEDPQGLRSRTDTRGPFTETRVYRDAAEYGLFFTPTELGLLTGGSRRAGTTVGSIRVASPWRDTVTGPHWWEQQTWTS